MQAHLLQAESNQKFLDCLNENFPDSFYDWKVTVTFYIAVHLLRALAKKRGKTLGRTHQDIFKSLGPKANPKLFQIPDRQWLNYYSIQKYSECSRYDGFIDKELYEQIQKKNYEHCCEMMRYFRQYVESQISPSIA